MIDCTHFFLEHVFDAKEDLVRSCGFRPFVKQAEGSASTRTVWVEPFIFTGPLRGMDRGGIGAWLRKHAVAGQIYEARQS